MSVEKLARIEAEARRMRAEVLSNMVRGLFRRTPRASVAGARTA